MMPQIPPPVAPPGTPIPPGAGPSAMGGNPNLRPRDVFELFREGFATAGKVFPAFIVVTAIVALLTALVNYASSEFTNSILFGSSQIITPADLVQLLSGVFILAILIEIILKAIFSATMATFVFISYHYQKTGEKLSFGVAFQRAQPYLFTFIILDAIIHFLIQLGLLFLIIPGLFFAVWWSVSLPVLFEEKTGVFDSMTRSKDLVQGFKWHVLGYIILINIVGSFISNIIQQAFMINAVRFTNGGTISIDPTMYILALFAGTFVTYFFDGIDYMARPILFMDLVARQEQRRMMMAMYYPPQPGMIPPTGVPPPGTPYPSGPQPAAPRLGPTAAPSPYQYPPDAPSTAAVPACQNCGSPLEPNARFCPNCGTPVSTTTPAPGPTATHQATLTCKACGHSNPDDALFCENCGARLR